MVLEEDDPLENKSRPMFLNFGFSLGAGVVNILRRLAIYINIHTYNYNDYQIILPILIVVLTSN